MIKGLISLLEKKDFLDIGIKELCLVSEVNRSTFYAHYQNTFELLQDCKQYMVQTFIDSFTEEQKAMFDNKKYESEYLSKEFLLPFLKQVKKNRIIYETYHKINLAFEDEFFDKLIEKVSLPVSISRRKGTKDKVEITYITKFYLEGIHAIIDMWIKRGFKESEDKICELILHTIKE